MFYRVSKLPLKKQKFVLNRITKLFIRWKCIVAISKFIDVKAEY